MLCRSLPRLEELQLRRRKLVPTRYDADEPEREATLIRPELDHHLPVAFVDPLRLGDPRAAQLLRLLRLLQLLLPLQGWARQDPVPEQELHHGPSPRVRVTAHIFNVSRHCALPGSIWN